MLTVVSLSYNEADLASRWAKHYWAQGVDRILVSNRPGDDNTAELLRTEGVEVVEDTEEFCKQSKTMNELIATVGEGWIVPADMDEFWISGEQFELPNVIWHQTLKGLFDAQPDSVGMVWAQMFLHMDWEHRWPEPKRLQKVAFRWSPLAQVTMGNHGVSGVSGEARSGLLQIRELQFRSREHYKRKVRERLATLDPDLSPGDATHYRALEHLDDAGLDAEWDKILARDVVRDPIPA